MGLLKSEEIKIFTQIFTSIINMKYFLFYDQMASAMFRSILHNVSANELIRFWTLSSATPVRSHRAGHSRISFNLEKWYAAAEQSNEYYWTMRWPCFYRCFISMNSTLRIPDQIKLSLLRVFCLSAFAFVFRCIQIAGLLATIFSLIHFVDIRA